MPPSPTKRETRIPSPTSKKASRISPRVGEGGRGGGSSNKKSRSPVWSSPAAATQKKQTTPRTNGSGGSANDGSSSSSRNTPLRQHQHHPAAYGRRATPDPDSLDASLDMTSPGSSAKQQKATNNNHSNNKSNAEAYEYLFEDDEANTTTTPTTTRASNDGKDTPWMSMINKLYAKQSEEKNKWKKDVRTAKQKAKQYKAELRDNLQERLKFLESKVSAEQQQDGSICRAESSATQATQDGTSCSDEGTPLFTLRQAASSSSPMVKQEPSHESSENVEIVYEEIPDATLKKQVELLQQKIQQASLSHTEEKEHWLATLDEAAKATENGADMSRRVQGILEQVATDWQEVHDEELLTANETNERLEKRLATLERAYAESMQSHEEEKAQWHAETAKLKDDSRRLLKERNEYKAKLNRHRDELEKSKATLTELERKVDLCQRQTSLAQKQATQWQEKAAEKESDPRGLRQDPPSPVRPASMQQQLKRAMQERDAALKEAEQTCNMLEDYQNRLEKDRASYNQKLKKAEEKYEEELQRRLDEYKSELIDQYKTWPLSNVPPAELERRYRESVEKRNELATRMKQIQEQASKEKGEWKLKLEGALSENRGLTNENEHLRTQLNAIGTEQSSARANWESRLEQASKEWVERLSEIQQEHQQEKEELEETMKNLKEYKENAETLANETRKQLDHLKEKHRQDILDWKEREVRTSQKTLFEAKEQFAADMQALHQEIARLEKERTSTDTSHREQVEQLQKELEDRASKNQAEVERLEAQLKESAEKIEELELALDEFLDEHEEANALHEKFVEQHERESSEWDEERAELERQLEDRKQELEELQATKQQIEALAEELKVKIKQKDDTCTDLQEQKKELASLNEKLTDENTFLCEIQEENEQLKKSCDDLRNELKILKDNSGGLDDIQVWKQKSANFEKELSSWKEKSERLDLEIVPLKEKATKLESDLAHQSSNLKMWQDKSQRLEGELTRVTTAREDDSRQAVQRIESLEEENEELREGFEKQRQELLDWTTKVEDLEASWMRRIEQLRLELKNMEATKDDHKDEIKQLKNTLEEEREIWFKDNEELRTERTKLEKIRDEQLEIVQELEKQTTQMKIQHETNLKELRRQNEDRVKDLEEFNSKMRSACDEKDDEISKLRHRISEVDQAIGINGGSLAEVKALHVGELQELKEKAVTAKEDFRKQLEAARAEHIKESRALQDKLTAAEEEMSSFSRQTERLTTSLDQLQRAHEDAKQHWQAEVARVRAEKDKLEVELRSRDEQQQHQNVWRAHSSSLQQHQHSISSLVEGIRSDVNSVKNIVQSSIEQSKGGDNSSLGLLQGDLKNIRGTLEETLSKMSHETEALLGHRDQLVALTEASTRADEAHQRFFAQQERLISEMQSLRTQVSENSARQEGDETSMILDKVRLDLVEELHRKETELARKAAQITHLHEELQREKRMREKAEEEILTLNDQADAYGEELMRLQGMNKTLEETMQDIDMVKNSHEEKVEVHPNGDDNQSIASDDSSPMLDEALALAQSLTDLVHGSGSNEQETSVMEMLESLSDMMDQHDKGKTKKPKKTKRAGSVPDEVAVKSKPQFHTRVEGAGDSQLETVLFPDDEEPLPITSPPNRNFFAEGGSTSHLQLVVDNLYGRCQMLERERTQMMESTLELLQAARDANEAELHAALSTARRRSAEELLKVQEDSQRGMWSMYNKLCSFCRDDVALQEEKKEIM